MEELQEVIKPQKIERTLEEKRHHHNQWKQSGLNKRDYCKANDIATTTFSGWVKCFASDDQEKKNPPFLKIAVKKG